MMTHVKDVFQVTATNCINPIHGGCRFDHMIKIRRISHHFNWQYRLLLIVHNAEIQQVNFNFFLFLMTTTATSFARLWRRLMIKKEKKIRGYEAVSNPVIFLIGQFEIYVKSHSFIVNYYRTFFFPFS